MNRRTFIRSLMARIAGVVGAPLMRRRAEQRLFNPAFNPFDVPWSPPSSFVMTGPLKADGYYIDADKIRFVRGKPQTMTGWDFT